YVLIGRPMLLAAAHHGHRGRWLFSCGFGRQPSLHFVREHFWKFTCSDLALNGPPEIGPENLAVMFKKRTEGRLWERQELQKLLGKDVVLTHREPRFGGDFILWRPRFREFAKMTIGNETKLIVIVKDNAAVPGHAKIFRQQVPRKNVRGGKVFNRLPVVAPGSRHFVRGVFLEKKAKRAKTTLHIGVRDNDIAALHLHN